MLQWLAVLIAMLTFHHFNFDKFQDIQLKLVRYTNGQLISGLAKNMFLWISHSLLPLRVVEDEGTKLKTVSSKVHKNSATKDPR